MKPTSSRKLKEITPEDVQFDCHIIKDELHPDFWIDNKLKEDVRERLLEIGMRFFNYLGLEDVKLLDITLTGSMANYNFNEFSDADIHTIFSYSQAGDPALVRNMMLAKKNVWNTARKNLRVKGRIVELSPQCSSENHTATGQYSILNNRWLVVPPKNLDINVDENKVKTIVSAFMNTINKLELIEDPEERFNKAVNIKNDIVKLRRVSIDTGGQYSEGNICFKLLRNNESISKVFQVISKSMDETLSLAEAKKVPDSILLEDSSGDKQIRELVKKELELLLKKQFSTRPVLSKTEIERISANQLKKELKGVVTEKDVRLMIRQALIRQYHWFWDKRNTWVNQI